MTMIDAENRVFNSQQLLEFDNEGRMEIFDALAANLQRRRGLFRIGFSLGGLLLF